jgi:hypothetical protein
MTFIIIFGIVAFGVVVIPPVLASIREAHMRKTIPKDRKYEGDTQAYSAMDMSAGSDLSSGSGGSDSGGSSL